MADEFDSERFPNNFYQGMILKLDRSRGRGVVRSHSGKEIPFEFPFVAILGAGIGGQMPRMVRAIRWGGIVRALNLFSVLAENHPREPHLYLQLLGVDPQFQGKHYGSALLDRLKLEASARPEIAGVYLETATEANVAFYSSKGYEVLGELYPIGVRTWRMYQRKR